MGSATISDVAERAHVSTATVSRVLNRTGRVSPSTRDRVLRVAGELGYRPSGVARSLKLRVTRTLGLIVTDIENPYFPSLVRAVEDAARNEGYAILLGNASDDPEREAAYLDLLVERRVDGVVIAASSLGDRQGEWLADPPLPVVLVNTMPASVRLPAISSDNRAGARQAAEHVIGLGHRRLGFLAAPPSRNADSPIRMAGVRDAMAAAGLDPADLAVASGAAVVSGGEAAMAELLSGRERPTAVLAYNDLMAIGSLRAVRAAGLACPDDVSVVGFDDLELAGYVEPALTTVAQDQARMGQLAVRTLTRLLRPDAEPAAAGETGATGDARSAPGGVPPARVPPAPPPEVVTLPTVLRIRASTAPPRA